MSSISAIDMPGPAFSGGMNSRHAPNAGQPEESRLKHLCSEFESVLYSSMFKSMRSAIPKTELIYGGNAEDIFTSMLDEEYARLLSHSERSSFSEALYEQLKPR